MQIFHLAAGRFAWDCLRSPPKSESQSSGSCRWRRARGFTLIELMLVVIIIGIIATIAVPRLAGRTEKARIAAGRQTIASLSAALDAFELSVGRFPTTEEGLTGLIEKPPSLSSEDEWDGPYMREIPADPWNRPYVYTYPGEQSIDYDLISLGRDGQEGSDDDITNYTKTE